MKRIKRISIADFIRVGTGAYAFIRILRPVRVDLKVCPYIKYINEKRGGLNWKYW